MSDPDPNVPITPGGPCPWPFDADSCGFEIGKGPRDLSVAAATEILWAATGRRFGECAVTVRPCRRTCVNVPMGQTWWEFGSTYPSYPQPMLFDGAWFNLTCGTCGDSCSCHSVEEVVLPGAVTEIVEVVIDGVVLGSSAYRVDNGRLLVRQDGKTWPTCFPADTLILTSEGLIPIEQVRVGQQVLTHRNRWRRVTGAGKTGESEILSMAGIGGVLRSTPDHRVWAREQFMSSDRQRKLGSPEWVTASHSIGHARATPSDFEPLSIPLPGAWTTNDLPPSFWWMVGRWVGDGWTDRNGARVLICAGLHQADYLASRLAETGWEWRRNPQGHTDRFGFSNSALWKWLRQEFGVGAAGKRLPAWLLGASEEIRQAVMDGYVSADGWVGRDHNRGTSKTSTHTVSRELALGTRLLAASLGYAATVYSGKSGSGGPAWLVNWSNKKPGNPYSQAWNEDGHLWLPTRRAALGIEIVPVYDLEIEEDGSFVADGFVVHNCNDLSKPAGQHGTWTVEALYGLPVPQAGLLALSELACELMKAVTEDPACRLPGRLQTLTRQGVTQNFLDPATLVREGGLVTGLRLVNYFIETFNPYRLAQRSEVFNLDLPQPRIVG